jgi:hypothetical protein
VELRLDVGAMIDLAMAYGQVPTELCQMRISV